MAVDTRADADTSGGDGVGGAADPTGERIAIEVRDVSKTFRIPTHRISRLKERVVRPLARREYRQLEALRDVGFDVHEGEFFGIVGRNGSGKSTLLKVMASIYRADAGSVRMAGRVAPFIELGVGFDMELSARENIVLNGVMMGLTPKEARLRIDHILGFAELEDFAEVKLKNFSSGMLVRLGFSIMIEADTDILLIDEVLAVGDAAFQLKCAEVFQRMRGKKTIVLVTHDMAAVERYCHRALLLNKGSIVQVGDPGQVAKRYLSLNFEQGFETAQGDQLDEDADVRLLDAWLEDSDGARVANVEQGKTIRIGAALEVKAELSEPRFGFVVADTDDVYIHEFVATPAEGGPGGQNLKPGQRVTVTVELSNRLAPGRYFVHHGVGRVGVRDYPTLWIPHALGFGVFGDQESLGMVTPEHHAQVTTQDPS